MPRDLFEAFPAPATEAAGPKDVFAAPVTTTTPQPRQKDFSQVFEEYRSGAMDPAKVPAFEELLRRKMPRMFHDKSMQPMETGSELMEKGIKNLPGSVMEEGKNVVTALASPLDTAETVAKMGGAALQAMSPSSETETAEDEQYWDTFAEDFSKKYGSLAGFAGYAAKEPAAAMMDIAGLFTLGGTTMAKVPGMAKQAKIMTDIGNSLDMVYQGGRGAVAAGKKAAQGGGAVVDELIGMTTGVGGDTIKQAKSTERSLFNTIEDKYKGTAPKGAGFEQARKGDISVNELAGRAKTAIADVREQRAQTFKEHLVAMEGTEASITTDNIAGSLAEGMQKLKVGAGEKGFDYSMVSPNSGDRSVVKNVVDRVMKQGDMASDLTPEGMLELRNYLDKVKSKSPEIVAFVDDIKKSIDDTLNEVPGYDKLRKDIDSYDTLISEFEKTLGLGPDKSGQEIVRKLVAVGSEDIGLRRRLLSELEAMTDTSLAAEIAGMEMQRTLPKAMVTRAAGGGMVYGMGGSVKLLLTLAGISSPRLMGKLLNQYGYSRNTVKTVINNLKASGAFDQKVTTSAALAGRTQNEEEQK